MFFIRLAVDEPMFYMMVITTVMVSIVLHELAHGVAALRQGDDTPRRLGHLTLNPLVHMGGFSMMLLFLVGIAWGVMPVNPARFRSRYGEAIVAAAGPLTNLTLALVALTALALWVHHQPEAPTQFGENARFFLNVFGQWNLVLCLFNLAPVPPLDGSAILANFHHGYARIAFDPAHQQTWWIVFIFVFMFAGSTLFELSHNIALRYMSFVVAAAG